MNAEILLQRDLKPLSDSALVPHPVSAQIADATPLACHGDNGAHNMSIATLRAVKRQHLDAFWNAPQTAHDWHILAAIHGAWESLGVAG